MNILNDIKSNVLDIEEFNFYNDFQLLSSLLTQWNNKAKDRNLSEKTRAELDAATRALTQISLYVMSMQQRQRGFNIQLNRFRDAKLEADIKLKELQYESKEIRE